MSPRTLFKRKSYICKLILTVVPETEDAPQNLEGVLDLAACLWEQRINSMMPHKDELNKVKVMARLHVKG
jgi:hypothetical protein